MKELYESGLFATIDRHFADFVARFGPAPAEEIRLAAALVSRAAGEGHVCLDLQKKAGNRLTDEGWTRVRRRGCVSVAPSVSWARTA